tara:strand:+ start:1208 stop:1906 length:699 start_codon:yes stop_codon:yes gene_type:complete
MSPEAPVPIFKVLKTEKKGGMALNVKSNLEGLGAEVTLFTNDKEIVKARHIDNKSRQHLLRVDWGEEVKVKPLTAESIGAIDFDSYDGIVISDYNKGLLNTQIIKQILSKTRKKPVFVDSKKKDLSCYENCILKINKKENDCATNFPSNFELIVTLGEDGVLYRGENFTTKKVEIFDVCGAGDTFLSALACAYLTTNNMERSIEFANHCSGIVVQKFGTYAIKREDISDLCF